MKKQIWISATCLLFLSVNGQNYCFAQISSELVKRAQAEIQDSRLTEKTLQDLQQAVQSNERDADAHLYLGLMLERMGLKDEAYAQYALAVKYGPQNPDALVALVKKEIKQGHIPSAIQMLRSGLDKFPNNPEMLLIVGDYLIQNKQMDEARTVLETAFKVKADIFGLPTSLGQIYLNGHQTRAVKLASMDLAKDPKFDRALRVRGVAYMMLGDYQKAIIDLKPVFDNAPNVPGIAEGLFDSYMSVKNYKEALRPGIFMLAFTALPDVSNARLQDKLVHLLDKLPFDYVQTQSAQIEKEIDERSPIAAFHLQLGQVFDKAGHHQMAMSQYQRAIELDPKYVQAYYQLGLDYESKTNDWRKALGCYQTAHFLRSWDAKIYLSYLRLLDRMHNKNNDLAQKTKSLFRGF
ncbi:MAG: tetratricopeptide repeat protein [Cyanobacteria bacterium TGS_CYA1]|nr:tetratricopeptide repeat protein [Cyanobacteria bacterium TGS_CYA1]